MHSYRLFLTFLTAVISTMLSMSCNQKSASRQSGMGGNSSLATYEQEGDRDLAQQNQDIMDERVTGAEAIRALAAGQAQLAKKQQELWDRVDKLEERITKLEQGLQEALDLISGLDRRLTTLEGNFGTLKSVVDQHVLDIQGLKDLTRNLNQALTMLTGLNFGDLPYDQIAGKVQDLFKALGADVKNIGDLANKLSQIDKMFPETYESLGKLETEFLAIATDLSNKKIDPSCVDSAVDPIVVCEKLTSLFGKTETEIKAMNRTDTNALVTNIMTLIAETQPLIVVYRDKYATILQRVDARGDIPQGKTKEGLATRWQDTIEPQLTDIKNNLVTLINILGGHVDDMFADIKKKQTDLEILANANAADIKKIQNSLTSSIGQLEVELANELMKAYSFGAPNPSMIATQAAALAAASGLHSNVIMSDSHKDNLIGDIDPATFESAAKKWKDWSNMDNPGLGKKLGEIISNIEKLYYNGEYGIAQPTTVTDTNSVHYGNLKTDLKAYLNSKTLAADLTETSRTADTFTDDKCHTKDDADQFNVFGVVEPFDFIAAEAINMFFADLMTDADLSDKASFKSGERLVVAALREAAMKFTSIHELDRAMTSWQAGLYKAPNDQGAPAVRSSTDFQKLSDEINLCTEQLKRWARAWLTKERVSGFAWEDATRRGIFGGDWFGTPIPDTIVTTYPDDPATPDKDESIKSFNALKVELITVIDSAKTEWGAIVNKITDANSNFLTKDQRETLEAIDGGTIVLTTTNSGEKSAIKSLEGAFSRAARVLVDFSHTKYNLELKKKVILSGLAKIKHDLAATTTPADQNNALAKLFSDTYLPPIAALGNDTVVVNNSIHSFQDEAVSSGKLWEVMEYMPTRLDGLEDIAKETIAAVSTLLEADGHLAQLKRLNDLAKSLTPPPMNETEYQHTKPMLQKLFHQWDLSTVAAAIAKSGGHTGSSEQAECEGLEFRYGASAHTNVSNGTCAINFRDITTAETANELRKAQAVVIGNCDYMIVESGCYLGIHACNYRSNSNAGADQAKVTAEVAFIAEAMVENYNDAGVPLVPSEFNFAYPLDSALNTCGYTTKDLLKTALKNPNGEVYKNTTNIQFDVIAGVLQVNQQNLTTFETKFANFYSFVLNPHLWFGIRYVHPDPSFSATSSQINNLHNSAMKFIPMTISAQEGKAYPYALSFPETRTIATYQHTVDLISPVVLDFTPEDSVKTLAVNESSVYFDLDGNGTKEQTGWISGSQAGFLALDLNQDGVINSGKELFGNHSFSKSGSSFANGYKALSHYDDNQDAKITSQDKIFNSLVVWFDQNQDGVSQRNEIKTLTELQVTEISSNYQEVKAELKFNRGNMVKFESSFKGPGQCGDSGCKTYDIFFNTLNQISDIR